MSEPKTRSSVAQLATALAETAASHDATTGLTVAACGYLIATILNTTDGIERLRILDGFCETLHKAVAIKL